MFVESISQRKMLPTPKPFGHAQGIPFGQGKLYFPLKADCCAGKSRIHGFFQLTIKNSVISVRCIAEPVPKRRIFG